jgi:hypothetical protein
MLSKAIPVAAQDLLNAIASCQAEVEWAKGVWLHPQGKVVFNGVIEPGKDGWVGDSPKYLIAYWHPRCQNGRCDAHWFALDIISAQASRSPTESISPASQPKLTAGSSV